MKPHEGGTTPPPGLRLGCGLCPLLFGEIGVRPGLRKLRPRLLLIYRLRAPNLKAHEGGRDDKHLHFA